MGAVLTRNRARSRPKPSTAAAVPNRQYRSVGVGKYNPTTDVARFSMSPDVVADNLTDYGAGFSFNAATGVSTPAAATTLVNSPIAGVCFSCHDSSLARQHMESSGGSIYKPRSTALASQEQCALCHTSGNVADIKLIHAISR